MKKNIEAPVVKIMQFVEQDVICTSGEDSPIPSGNVDPTGTANGMNSPFRGQAPTSTGW